MGGKIKSNSLCGVPRKRYTNEEDWRYGRTLLRRKSGRKWNEDLFADACWFGTPLGGFGVNQYNSNLVSALLVMSNVDVWLCQGVLREGILDRSQGTGFKSAWY